MQTAAALFVVFACAIAPSVRAADAPEIAPKGALRVAIAVGPAASAFWATRDPMSGEPRGVTVELAKAAAAKIGLPLRLIPYRSSDEIAAAGDKDQWDISFMPAESRREQLVDHGPAYVAYKSKFLLRAGSHIRSSDDVDRPGIKVACIEGTSTSRTLARSIKQASLVCYGNAAQAAELIEKGQVDALAMGAEAVQDLAKRIPGTRVLDHIIQSTGVVIVVPKGREAAKVWAAQFLRDAKQDGTVRRALDAGGSSEAQVEP